MPDFLPAFALIAIVLTVTALAAGLVERSPLSFPIMFLGLGFALGERGLGIISLSSHSPILEIVGALTLSLVLFLDAVKLQVEELGKRWIIPALILGPCTVIIIALGALPLVFLLGFGWVMAFIGGAILASTDPVVLRDILRDSRIPRSVRQVLKIEGGMNDIVVLPVILILIAVAQTNLAGPAGWVGFLLQLLVLGPIIGFAIGGVGSWAMARIDAAMGIRTEYQALYGVGLVLAAFTASTFAGGDGFLGAFFAGLAVVTLNQNLCDCFLDYGETTSEMAMLLAFVLFGVVLSSMIHTVELWQTVVLAALVVFVLRPSVFTLFLAKAKLSWEARLFLSWFGPRGLNSLLLALLVVQANIPGAEFLLATVGVVVIASVTIHGASATPFAVWYGRKADKETLAEERESTVVGLFDESKDEMTRYSPQELDELLAEPNPPIILDVRSRSAFDHDKARIPGDVRVLPDQVIEWAKGQSKDRLVIAYCT